MKAKNLLVAERLAILNDNITLKLKTYYKIPQIMNV